MEDLRSSFSEDLFKSEEDRRQTFQISKGETVYSEEESLVNSMIEECTHSATFLLSSPGDMNDRIKGMSAEEVRELMNKLELNQSYEQEETCEAVDSQENVHIKNKQKIQQPKKVAKGNVKNSKTVSKEEPNPAAEEDIKTKKPKRGKNDEENKLNKGVPGKQKNAAHTEISSQIKSNLHANKKEDKHNQSDVDGEISDNELNVIKNKKNVKEPSLTDNISKQQKNKASKRPNLKSNLKENKKDKALISKTEDSVDDKNVEEIPKEIIKPDKKTTQTTKQGKSKQPASVLKELNISEEKQHNKEPINSRPKRNIKKGTSEIQESVAIDQNLANQTEHRTKKTNDVISEALTSARPKRNIKKVFSEIVESKGTEPNLSNETDNKKLMKKQTNSTVKQEGEAPIAVPKSKPKQNKDLSKGKTPVVVVKEKFDNDKQEVAKKRATRRK